MSEFFRRWENTVVENPNEHPPVIDVLHNWDWDQRTNRRAGLPGVVMDGDEIRMRIEEARRACAEAAEIPCGVTVEGRTAARNAAALARLIEATEWLLRERELFAGRLRRTAMPPTTGAPILPPPAPLRPPADSTP